MDQALAQLVRERAHGSCEYCHMLEICDRPGFEIEHIIARQHGGSTTAGNLAWACFTCNKKKGPNLSGIDSVTGKVRPGDQRRKRPNPALRNDAGAATMSPSEIEESNDA